MHRLLVVSGYKWQHGGQKIVAMFAVMEQASERRKGTGKRNREPESVIQAQGMFTAEQLWICASYTDFREGTYGC